MLRRRSSRRPHAAISRAAILAVALALVATVLLGLPATAQSPSPMPDDEPRTVTLIYTLTGEAADQHFHTAGRNGELTYGTGRLTGTSTLDGAPVGIELLASVGYTDGSGPFTGWITIGSGADDTMGLEYEGFVTRRGERTLINGTVRVVAGTGAWVDASGSGRVSGRREGTIGSDVVYTLTLTLQGLPPASYPSVFADPHASGEVLYRAYGDLVIAKDVAGLEAALDPAYRIVRADGSSATRDEYLANLPDLRAFTFTDAHELRTADTITLLVTVQTDLVVDGTMFSRDPAPVLVTFRWDGTRWTVVSHANFNAPQGS